MKSMRTSALGAVGARNVQGWLGPLLGVALVVALAVSAGAQEIPGLPGASTEEATPADPTSGEKVAERLAAARDELEAVGQEIERAGSERAEHLAIVRTQLKKISAVLEQQASHTRPLQPQPTEVAEVTTTSPSIFALNDLYEAQFSLEREVADRKARIDAARKALDVAKERLDSAAKARREARAALEDASPDEKGSAERKLELQELAVRLAQETVHLRTLETRSAVDGRSDDSDAQELDARIEAMREALARGEGAAKSGFAESLEREGELRRLRERAERRLGSAELILEAAQNRFAQQAQASPELLEEVEALTARRDAIRQEIALIDTQLERTTAQRELWRNWEALLRVEPLPEDLGPWEAAATERFEALQLEEVQSAGRLADLASRLESLERRNAEGEPTTAARDQVAALLQLRERLHADSRWVAADLRLTQRVLDDIQDHTGHINPLEYVARAWKLTRDAWRYEITTVDDSPITVGSLILALFLFSIGLWAARRGSSIVARVSEDRFKLDTGAVHALQTLSFYALLVGFALLALRAVHFPLTAFTVLGGALAIGIGFGSQNVMNNFISGLILMLERPVRARDVIEVDGNHGTIENIGARSTQIRSTDGRHIIVPNSFFLESNVVNWTRSDDLMRAKVTVGVIYGSPTRLVEELIRRVVDEDDHVLKRPVEPIIIFEEFGDNSLNFDVYFWVRARSPMEMRKVQSRVRFRIDDLFREHELVIAFPQRDVHLDSVAPLEVRVLNGSGGSASDPSTKAS